MPPTSYSHHPNRNGQCIRFEIPLLLATEDLSETILSFRCDNIEARDVFSIPAGTIACKEAMTPPCFVRFPGDVVLSTVNIASVLILLPQGTKFASIRKDEVGSLALHPFV